MPSLSGVLVRGLSYCAIGAVFVPGVAAAQGPATGPAPGAPGIVEQALAADQSGVGTSTTRTSKVWGPVQKEGGLGELCSPTIDAPSARALFLDMAVGCQHPLRTKARALETTPVN